MPLDNAGISDAVILEVEAGPVKEPCATVLTSTVTEPDGVAINSTAITVPEKYVGTQEI